VPNGRAGEALHALEEPLPLAAGLRDELVPLVQVREGVGTIPHALCGFAGLVFGLSGINAHGLAVSSGSLVGSVRSSRGRLPALLVGEILAAAPDGDAALNIARQFISRTPWNACITDSASGRICYLEHDGAALDVREPAEAMVASTGRDAGASGRLRRLTDMLGGAGELSSAAGVRQALARCGNGGSQHDGNGSIAVAAHAEDPVLHIIMQPGNRQFWVGGVGPANGSLLGVRLEELRHGGLAPVTMPAESLKKKDLSRPPRA
jgi:hypothetical protein